MADPIQQPNDNRDEPQPDLPKEQEQASSLLGVNVDADGATSVFSTEQGSELPADMDLNQEFAFPEVVEEGGGESIVAADSEIPAEYKREPILSTDMDLSDMQAVPELESQAGVTVETDGSITGSANGDVHQVQTEQTPLDASLTSEPIVAHADGADIPFESIAFSADSSLSDEERTALDVGSQTIIQPPEHPEPPLPIDTDPGNGSGAGNIKSDSPDQDNPSNDEVIAITRAPDNSVQAADQYSLKGLAARVGIDEETIKNKVTGEIKSYSVTPDADLELTDGMCTEASVHICDGVALVKLSFQGSNLRDNTDNASIEFSIEPLTDAGELTEKLQKILADQTPENSSLNNDKSLTNHHAVDSLLTVIQSPSELNARITTINAENAFIKIDPDQQAMFQDSILGGTTPVHRAVNPDCVAPALANVTIEGGSFAGIAGEIKNSRLTKLTVLHGDIDINLHGDSEIIDITATGSSLHGTIDGTLSGDFRGATLGTQDRPLGGQAFACDTAEGTELSRSSLEKLKNFVVDIKSSDRSIGFQLNGLETGLNQLQLIGKVKLGTAESLATHPKLTYITNNQLTGNTRTFIESFESEPRIDDGQVQMETGHYTVTFALLDPAGGQNAESNGPKLLAFNPNDPEQRLSKLQVQISGPDGSTPDVLVPAITPDRALYLYQQVQRLDDDARAASLRSRLTEAAGAATARSSGTQIQDDDSLHDPIENTASERPTSEEGTGPGYHGGDTAAIGLEE